MKKRYKKQAKVAMAVALATSSVVNSTGHILAQEETKVNEYNSIDNEEVKEEQEIEEDLLEEESKEVEAKQEVEEKNLETIEREEIQNTDQIEEVIINKENFPDAIFREYIRSKFDRNQDGILSSTELDAVIEIFLTNVHVSNSREITSLKGIEYFKNLKNLYCQKTGITSIDVSKNTALRHIEVNGSYLEEIDVSKNTALEKLLCFDMPNLMSINVQGASALKTLYCYNNPKLRGLDVSGNPNLEYLYIKGTTNYLGTDLAWLKMGGHPKLQDNDSYFKAITSEINIGEVDRTFNIKEMFPGIELDRITNVTGAEIDLTTGVVSNYRNEQIITYQYRTGGTISGAKSILLNVQLRFQTHATPRAQEIAVVQGREPNPADGIANKDSLMEGTTYEWEGGAPDTSEIGIVTGNIILHYPDGFDDRVDNVSVNVGIEINEENFPDAIFREYVGGKYFDKNQDGILSSTELDAVTAIHVTSSYVSNPRELTSLKGIEYFKNLETLYCYGTGITSIDVSQNTALELLYVNDTPLEEIDVSKNPSLKQLNCSDMPNLTSINVQGASALTRLDCYNNPKLRGLDVSGNKELNILNVESKTAGSYLAWLHVGENPNLSNISGTSTNIVNSTIDMGEVARTFNIKEQFPGIDPTKIISIGGATIDKETGVVVRSRATVTYAYDSGIKSGNGKVILNVTLNFTRQNADDYAPQGQDITVFKGEVPNAADGIANKGDLPEGTSYDWKETPDTSAEGTVEGTIVVSYPDGSREEVTININVAVKDEEKYTPQGQDLTVYRGETPNAADGIANKGDLPQGTTYAWESTPDTSAEGEVEATIVVSYPDRTSEEVTITINVLVKDEEKYTPQGQDITVFKGETPNAADGIANKDALPQGTTYTWAQEPNTSAEGTVEGTIVVSYPDRTSEEVTININVAVKDEEKYTPIVDNNKEINKGETPKVEDFIVNKDELPNGTQYEWVEEPDTSVEGTTTGVLKVTYPDGTSDICDVTMNVVSKEETSPEQGWITIEGTLDKRYDGQAVLEPTVKKPEGSGEVTFEWYTADGIKLDTAPVDAGSYKVKVILEANENYTGAEVEIEFEIYKATTSVSIIGELSKEYDGKPVATPEVKVVGSTGQVSYEWYRKEETAARAITWKRLEEAPVEIGSYKLVVRVAGDKNYEGTMAEKEFTISKVGENTPDKPEVVPTPPYGGIIVNPDGGEITVKPGDNIESNGPVVENPDGSITFPNGGTVTKPDGSTEVIQPGGVLNPNKPEVVPTPPYGGIIVNPDGGEIVVKPGDNIESNGPVVENPDGSITFPEGGTVTKPDGSEEVIQPGGVLNPNKPEVVPTPPTGGIIVNPDGGEIVVKPGDNIESNGPVVENPDGSITFPEGGTVTKPDGSTEIIQPGGTLKPNKPEVVPTPPYGGIIVNPDGGEIVVKPGDNIESNGPVVENPDGSITFPNGGTVTKPDGSTEVIQPGGVLNPNKPVVVPTPPNGGTITNPDGSVEIIQPGATLAPNGKEEIVQPGENINGVQTGDKTQVGLWSILAGLSTGMMMLFRRKRKKEE